MEENELMNSDTMDDVLDNAWDEEDGMEFDDGAELPADQPAAEQEGTPAPERAGEQPAADQPQQVPADQPELFTLRNREETRQVTRDELVAMAQKGWDYDTVRQERDQLRQYRQEADPALDLVKGYAQRSGMTVPEYLDYCRKQELMRGGMDERSADQTLQFEKREADVKAREDALAAKAQQENGAIARAKAQQEARQRDMQQFLQAYPDVKADAIPKEVWEQVAKGTPLVNAYTMHENKRLQAELAAERQNKANRQRTPGSLGGNAAAELDEIDRVWNEDD